MKYMKKKIYYKDRKVSSIQMQNKTADWKTPLGIHSRIISNTQRSLESSLPAAELPFRCFHKLQ